MIPMTKKARAAAKTLAIAYLAFSDAQKDGNDNGIIVWARKLLEIQEELGIELHKPNTLKGTIAIARAREARREAGTILSSAEVAAFTEEV